MKYDIFVSLFYKLMLRKISLFLLLLTSLSGYATHLRSGEISYVALPGQPNTFLITFTIYTNADVSADLNILSPSVNLGDGTVINNLMRENGPAGFVSGKAVNHIGEIVSPGIRKNIYSVVHTYSTPGPKIISTAPSARNGGILNISNSLNCAMYIEAKLTVGLTPMSSPELTFPPIDDGCTYSQYKLNPGAVDPDGDELRFSLVKCKTTNGADISTYKYPNEVDPSVKSTFKMDPRSGVITWNMPTEQGQYNISFKIEKYRGGVLIGYVLRDMQVTIAPCANRPPMIDPVPDICIQAGTPIKFKVTSSDPDGDTLKFETSGMPYDLAISPAVYTPDSTAIGFTSGTFTWNTIPSHFRKTAYQVYYRVSDSHNGSVLTDVFSNFISLIAPSVKNVTSTVYQKGFKVEWEKTSSVQAVGYNIYRKIGPSNIPFDSCMLGLPLNSGFALVGSVNGLNTTSYIDPSKGSGLPSGYNYCYVVTAAFDGGAESAPSDPTCSFLMYPFISVLQDTLINCQWSTITLDSTIIKFINTDQKTLYKWSSSPDLQLTNKTSQYVSAKLLTTGVHTLKIVSTSGSYIDSAKIYIQVNPIPSPKIKYIDLSGWPDSVMFFNRSTSSVRAEWLFPDGTRNNKFDSVLFIFEKNGYYPIHLTVYNSLGCPDTTTITYRVVMKGVAFPNAFEPNNPSDKLNTFRPLAVGIQTYYLGIWDLWGNLVWSSDKLDKTEPAEGWDGTDSKGRKMPTQNYIWRMKATFIDGTVWKGVKDHFGKFHSEGTFTLLR